MPITEQIVMGTIACQAKEFLQACLRRVNDVQAGNTSSESSETLVYQHADRNAGRQAGWKEQKHLFQDCQPFHLQLWYCKLHDFDPQPRRLIRLTAGKRISLYACAKQHGSNRS